MTFKFFFKWNLKPIFLRHVSDDINITCNITMYMPFTVLVVISIQIHAITNLISKRSFLLRLVMTSVSKRIMYQIICPIQELLTALGNQITSFRSWLFHYKLLYRLWKVQQYPTQSSHSLRNMATFVRQHWLMDLRDVQLTLCPIHKYASLIQNWFVFGTLNSESVCVLYWHSD